MFSVLLQHGSFIFMVVSNWRLQTFGNNILIVDFETQYICSPQPQQECTKPQSRAWWDNVSAQPEKHHESWPQHTGVRDNVWIYVETRDYKWKHSTQGYDMVFSVFKMLLPDYCKDLQRQYSQLPSSPVLVNDQHDYILKVTSTHSGQLRLKHPAKNNEDFC